MKCLFIIRGCPNAGKSSLAKSLDFPYFEADQYFEKDGEYKFDQTMLGYAHNDCRRRLELAMMQNIPKLIVSNTSTTERELLPYYELAETYGYTVFSLILERRHNNKNEHNVPEDSVRRMAERLFKSIKLF